MAVRVKTPKIKYAETYRNPGVKIADAFLPTCPHITNPTAKVEEMYLLKAGNLDDGREFQDIRLYIRVE